MVSSRIVLPILGSWLIHVCLGTLYTWANITPYVTAYFRWRGDEVDYADMSWVVSLAGFALGLFMFLGGRLQLAIGLQPSVLVGGWLFSLGVGLSSYTIKLGRMPFLLSYGIVFGMGIGLTYTAPMVCLTQWMPESRGFAYGIVVFAFGSGAAIFNFLQEMWANPTGINPSRHIGSEVYYDWDNATVVLEVLDNVPPMFTRLALTYAVLTTIGSALLVAPASDRPSVNTAGLTRSLLKQKSILMIDEGRLSEHSIGGVQGRQYSLREMTRTFEFWLFAFAFFCNVQGVYFSIAFSKTLGETLAISDRQITLTLAAASFVNGAGRPVWGNVADRTSFRFCMLALCATQAILLITLPFCDNRAMYFIWICGIFLCVGGNFALFPMGVASYFGDTHFGVNYGVVFLGNSFGMLSGPIFDQILRASVQEAELQNARCLSTASFVIMAGCATALMSSPKAMQERAV